MDITVNLGSDRDYTDFVKSSLINNLYKYVRLNLSETKLKKIDNYLKLCNVNMTTKQIIDFYFRHLNIENTKGTYKVTVDKAVTLPESNMKLDQVIRLIEYGNLEVPGLHIFDKTCKDIQDNVYKLYKKYLLRV